VTSWLTRQTLLCKTDFTRLHPSTHIHFQGSWIAPVYLCFRLGYTERVTDQMNADSDSEQLKRRNRELSILNVIAQALNRSVDLDQTLDAALAHVTELLNLQTGWVWLLHQDSGDSYLAASQNLPPALAEDPRRMQGSCYCLRTYIEGDLEGAANTNVVECSRLHGLMDGTEGLLYHASIPLYVHEKKLGVMNVASPDWRPLSPSDLRLLYTIGDLLGIAIERSRLFAHSAMLGALEERNRLAREIHDTLAQGLTAVSLQLESADAILESKSDPDLARGAIRRALKLTRGNLEEARRSVLNLRAAPLEGRSLSQALLELSAGMKTPVGFNLSDSDGKITSRVESGLYRIAREALANADRHARAKQVIVELSITSRRAKLIVEDDGQGFEPQTVPAGHFGLIGMNERARLLGGDFKLQSGPGSGTKIEVTIPLV